jgi:hypothetical protein
MNERVRLANRRSKQEQELARRTCETHTSFRTVGLTRAYFCPFQLRELDDTWTRAQSKQAIAELIAEARGLDANLIFLTQLNPVGLVYHGAYAEQHALTFTIFHGPKENAKPYMAEWATKDLRKVGKRLGFGENLTVLEPVVLTDDEIRARMK